MTIVILFRLTIFTYVCARPVKLKYPNNPERGERLERLGVYPERNCLNPERMDPLYSKRTPVPVPPPIFLAHPC